METGCAISILLVSRCCSCDAVPTLPPPPPLLLLHLAPTKNFGLHLRVKQHLLQVSNLQLLFPLISSKTIAVMPATCPAEDVVPRLAMRALHACLVKNEQNR